MRNQYAEFEKRDTIILTIVPQDPVRAQSFKQRLNPPFTILADPTCWTSAVYGVAKQLNVHAEWVNAPSVFLVDKQGILRWAHVGKGFNDRPSAAAILAEVEKVLK